MTEIVRSNPFQAPRAPSAAPVEVEQSRAIAETQAAVALAKRFPRNEHEAYEQIMQACQRPSLASEALYTYKRGGTPISGASIRLAETIARAWGNIAFGTREIERRNGESVMQAYAWDMQTNTRREQVFTVKHERATKQKTYALTDQRDIYEMTANLASRRVRACILALIPRDIVDDAVDLCRKTSVKQLSGDLEGNRRTMVSAFAKLGVNVSMLEEYLGRKIADTSEADIAELRSVFQTIRDDAASRDAYFSRRTGVMERLKGNGRGKTPAQGSEPVQGPSDATLVAIAGRLFDGDELQALISVLEGMAPQELAQHEAQIPADDSDAREYLASLL